MRPEPMPRSPQPCDRIQVLLPGFVSEELADEQLGEVHTHLRECVACRCDAADYMQATKALHRAAVAATVEIEVPFDDMHAEIMQRVTADDVVAVAESPWGTRLMLAAAAVLLASFGFWLGTDPEPQSIWVRPGGLALVDEAIVVVPYTGSPAEIRPVLLEYDGGVENGFGTGMGARGVNRIPVELLPAKHYVNRK
ncbi:MAG: hypothetical protein ACI89X_000853 [Planctomycetota bacterium]|jgi:hypothetical protein